MIARDEAAPRYGADREPGGRYAAPGIWVVPRSRAFRPMFMGRGAFLYACLALPPSANNFHRIKQRGESKMKAALEAIKDSARQALEGAGSPAELEELRVKYLGKKGELTAILKQMGGLSPEERPIVGQLANAVRESIEALIAQRGQFLRAGALSARLAGETIDVTMPGKQQKLGGKHPLTTVLDEIKEIFLGMGFSAVEGPEVELDYYNFEALNMPKNHPSRDTQDTFYISQDIVLRTQTSSVQVRAMEQRKPPMRVIVPGRVYRSDAVDATHSPVFHQIEGLVVDKDVTMADLKGTLQTFARLLYGDDVQVRFRPHHFSFTEPSAEMDAMCFACQGAGCRLCKGEGWIEILGCGMVHPKVLRFGGIDPDEYSGFAFGMGLERMVMRRYGIDDLRLFFENDLRFLGQFA